MSWHYSQALEEAFSAANFSDGGQSAPSKSKQRQGKSSSQGKTTGVSNPSLCGTMCRPSTENHGLELWMSSLAASRAKTYPQQEKAPGSKVSVLDSGDQWLGSFAKWDRDSCSWKTHQFSLLGGLESYCETWPRWGMMRDGACWELSMPAHLTSEKESGSWPTIRSSDGERGGRGDLIQAVRGNENSHFRLWQTPVADDAVNREAGKINSRGEPKLSAQVKLCPTPHGFSPDGRTNGPSGNELGRAVNQAERFPTPTSSMMTMADMEQAKTPGNSPNRPTYAEAKAMSATPTASTGGPEPEGKTGRKLVTQVGGSLNPPWVEWFMGWPLGWTDSAHSATDRFRQWCASHGISYDNA